MNNAVIYARFSSHGQNEQTIDSQIRICKEYAQKQGLNVIRIYDGDKAKSASKETEKRRELHKMFSDAETKTFQYIIVYKLDRFARNRNESRIFKSELQKHGVRVLSATEHITDDEGGELYEMILEWNDEKYSQRLSKIVLEGLDTSVGKGTFTGGYLIYGYKLIDSGMRAKKGSVVHKVIVDEEQAELVKFVFEEYAKGTDKKEIADMLNSQGHRYKGKLFKGRTFDRWLSNDKYTGEFVFGGREVKNMYPQIIDRLLFEQVQERLKRNAYFSGANSTKEPYLLTSKLRCGHCESLMTADKAVKAKAIYRYYACKKMRVSECDKKRENKESLEKDVVEIVVRFLKKPENLNKLADDLMDYQEQRLGGDGLRSLEVRINKTQQEVEELADAFVKAKSSLLQNTIEKKMNDFEMLLDDLQTQKHKLELERGKRITKTDIIDCIADLLQGDTNHLDYRRKIIDNLISVIYISDNGLIVPYLKTKDTKIVSEPSLDTTNSVLNNIFGTNFGTNLDDKEHFSSSTLLPTAPPNAPNPNSCSDLAFSFIV
ncbi:MAG: recombinase family protein [Firmicutes bacterium]|nr:recombinase family protein [Bacillota bacterium]